MKVILSFVLAVIVIGSAIASGGNEQNTNKVSKQPVSIKFRDQGKIELTVIGDSKGKVSVEIYKISGEKLFEEAIWYNKSFSLPIDLSQQEEGTFKFVVKGENINYEQEVFNSKLYNEDVYAMVEKVDDKVYNVKVLHEDTPVKISITDDTGREVFSKKYLQNSNFQQKFDLSNVESENLEITISGQKSYIRSTLTGRS